MSSWRTLTARWRRLPDFLIIGAQRSGTSTLYEYITRHDGVARAARKEVHFFDTYFDNGLDWYRAQFPFRDQRLTGEASPSYLFLPFVPARVKAALPSAKLIVILRNPIDRALSSYHHRARKKTETRPLEVALSPEQLRPWPDVVAMLSKPVVTADERHSYLARGLYADQLEMWLKYFPREQLLVLPAEAFFKDTMPVMNRVCDFLSIPGWSGDAAMQGWVKERYSYQRYAEMGDELRRNLAELFRPHNERLYRLVGEDFGWSG